MHLLCRVGACEELAGTKLNQEHVFYISYVEEMESVILLRLLRIDACPSSTSDLANMKILSTLIPFTIHSPVLRRMAMIQLPLSS